MEYGREKSCVETCYSSKFLVDSQVCCDLVRYGTVPNTNISVCVRICEGVIIEVWIIEKALYRLEFIMMPLVVLNKITQAWFKKNPSLSLCSLVGLIWLGSTNMFSPSMLPVNFIFFSTYVGFKFNSPFSFFFL